MKKLLMQYEEMIEKIARIIVQISIKKWSYKKLQKSPAPN